MMPFGGADGLRLDRQANAPAEDTARMRDHRVCKHGFRFPGSCVSTLTAWTPGPVGGGGWPPGSTCGPRSDPLLGRNDGELMKLLQRELRRDVLCGGSRIGSMARSFL